MKTYVDGTVEFNYPRHRSIYDPNHWGEKDPENYAKRVKVGDHINVYNAPGLVHLTPFTDVVESVENCGVHTEEGFTVLREMFDVIERRHRK